MGGPRAGCGREGLRGLAVGLCAVFAAAVPETDECRNPLFETHWFSGGGQTQLQSELSKSLSVQSNLRLCPAYNGVDSCCEETLEPEQTMHFNYWRQMLQAKLVRLAKNKRGTVQMQELELFNAASDQERDEYYRALGMYDKVLSPFTNGRCLTALLTYIAGMQCFACEKDWKQKVQTVFGKLVRVRLSGRTCNELWESCKEFGHYSRKLRQTLMDSRLASFQPTPLENLAMFHDQQALCDWTHDSVAMHPFTTPSEAQREAAPPPKAIERRLREDDGDEEGAERELMEGEEGEGGAVASYFDAMQAGRASGFDTSWAGSLVEQSRAGRPAAWLSFAVAASALALARWP